MGCRVLPEQSSKRGQIILLLAVASVLRLIWVAFIRPEYYSDFALYMDLAQSMADGNGYRMGGASTAFMPPGYPFWLTALIVLHVKPVIGQVVLGVLNVLLLYLLVQQLTGQTRAALFSGYALALYPNHIAYSSLMASELLHLCCVLAGSLWLILALRRSRPLMMMMSGLAFSYGTLVKAQVALVPAIILVAWIVYDRHAARITAVTRLCLVFLAVWLLVQTPWFVRNLRLFGEPVWVSTNHGYNMLIGFNPRSDGGYSLEALPKQEAINEVEYDRQLYRTAMRNLRNDPWRYITLLPRKLVRLYAGDGDGILYNYMHSNRAVMQACDNQLLCAYQAMLRNECKGRRWLMLFGLNLVFYIVFWGLFVASVMMYRRVLLHDIAPSSLTITWLIVIYYTLLSLVSFGGLRFHFVILPWMIASASCLFSVGLTTLSRRKGASAYVVRNDTNHTGDSA